MPKFSISSWVNNKGTATVSAHVGASLVNAIDGIEYYNASDDITKDFPVGKTWVYRVLNTDLGATGKYDLYIALWDSSQTIGTGTKYASVKISGAVEKKKKIVEVNLEISKPVIAPTSVY